MSAGTAGRGWRKGCWTHTECHIMGNPRQKGGVGPTQLREEEEGGEPTTYRIEFPKGGTRECPVEGCPGRVGTRTEMRVNFWRRHVQDVVIILEEGNLPHPRCPRCDMLVPWRSLNGRHKSTAMCRSGAERKRWQLAETEVQESTEMAFEVYGDQLKTVPRFKHLGRILTEGGNDWTAVEVNLGKARRSWGRMQRILSREGANKRVSGNFFKAVVQQVLLFGAETWVVTPRMEHALDSFIHGEARRITGRQPRSGWDGTWFYPSLEGAMKEAGFTDVRTSINRRQNKVAQYIATRPLLELCEGKTQRGGVRVAMRWWDQKWIDWGKAKARGAET